MKPGTKPKPAALRLVEGGSAPVNVPRPVPETLVEPDWQELFGLGTAAAQRAMAVASEEWRRVVPRLDKLGLLSGLDRLVVIDYCVCVGRLWQAERYISAHGIGGFKEGRAVRNPAIPTANQYRIALKSYIAQLGLSPSDRMRLSLPEDDDGDGLGID